MSDIEVTEAVIAETEDTPADEGDFTGSATERDADAEDLAEYVGTATGADGADNTDIGESVPAGDPEPEPKSGTEANPGDGDGGPLGESFDA